MIESQRLLPPDSARHRAGGYASDSRCAICLAARCFGFLCGKQCNAVRTIIHSRHVLYGCSNQFFIIKKEYFRHQPYFFNHFAFHQHSCPMQIRVGCGVSNVPLSGQPKPMPALRSVIGVSGVNPCELYILRRKSETDFGRYTSYFRTAFESLYQKRDCILLYVCVIIYQKDIFPFASRMPMLLPPENPLFSCADSNDGGVAFTYFGSFVFT